MTGPVTVNVEAFDGDTPLDATNLKAAITGDLWGITESGVHTFLINPAVAFGTARNAIGDFKVRLSLTDAPANASDILYKIVDLDPPYAVTDVLRRDFYNGKYGSFVTNFADIATGWTTSLDDVLIWTGVTEDDTYKTNKMVFRRIPAAGKSFNMQNNTNKVVTFTKDFYIGVFEVTQTQWYKFGTRTCWETNKLYNATRPATDLFMMTDSARILRGTWAGTLANHTWNGGYLGAMANATGLLVDLPTEAQWEFACRAGTTALLYSGKAYSAGEAGKLARMYHGTGNRNCDLSQRTSAVGSYKPNAWGLYDMIGNAWELCLDRWSEASDLPAGTDPLVANSSLYHVKRGASITCAEDWHKVTTRKSVYYGSSDDHDIGFRVCIFLDRHEDGTK
jgi:formylglycine-generating enzyme required for sulfatase activity